MIEEYFSIKRRCLKLEECFLFFFLNKDKDFNVLRKKIFDIILKLDKVVLEGEKFKGKINVDFKRELDFLFLENCLFKGLFLKVGEEMLYN